MVIAAVCSSRSVLLPKQIFAVDKNQSFYFQYDVERAFIILSAPKAKNMWGARGAVVRKRIGK